MIDLSGKRTVRVGVFAALAIYAVILVTLTHLPKPPGILERANDKTLHFLAYFVLGGLAYASAAMIFPVRTPVGVIVLFVGGIFAVLDEITQPLFGRSCSFLDWRADMLGLLVATIIMSSVRFLLSRIGLTAPPATTH